MLPSLCRTIIVLACASLGCQSSRCPLCEQLAPLPPDSGRTPAGRAASVLLAADRNAHALASAMEAIDKGLDLCAQNLANLDTTAYKAARGPGGDAQITRDFSQGALEQTGRQLDLGVSGLGFFLVKLPAAGGDGLGYTRNGNLFINRSGDLVAGAGDEYPLQPPVAIPKGTTDITIAQDGRIEVLRAGGGAKQLVGRLALHRFMNPEGLALVSGTIYAQTESSGPPTECRPGEEGAGMILQGFLEKSNVDATRESLRIRFLKGWREHLARIIER